jgi:hypothetical protein
MNDPTKRFLCGCGLPPCPLHAPEPKNAGPIPTRVPPPGKPSGPKSECLGREPGFAFPEASR